LLHIAPWCLLKPLDDPQTLQNKPFVEASSMANRSDSTSTGSMQTSQNAKLKNSPLPSFFAGFAGGSASTILLYPLDLVKTRLQVDEHSAVASNNPANIKRRTICCTVRGVINHEGYLGLYKGLTPAVIGSAASWGGFFIIYEELKRQILHYKMISVDARMYTSIQRDAYDVSKDMHIDEEMDVNSNDTNYTSKSQSTEQPTVKLGPIEHFTASCMAGACMVALTNPLWLIKTRLQLQNSRLQEQLSKPDKSLSVKPPYRGLSHAAYTIVKEEGFLALYKGSIPALMLVSHGGIQFVSYEFLKSRFARPEWKKSSGKDGGTIVERLRDSFGYLVMGAASKL
jgi:solute carrier family 25 folate transporter 32